MVDPCEGASYVLHVGDAFERITKEEEEQMKKLWRDRDGDVLTVRPSPKPRAEAAWRVETEAMVDLTQEQAAELAEFIVPTVREEDDGTYTVRLLGETVKVNAGYAYEYRTIEYVAMTVVDAYLRRKPKPKWHGLHSKLVEVLKTKGALDSAYTITCEGRRLDRVKGRSTATLTIADGVYCATFTTENDEDGHLTTRSFAKVCSYEDFWEVALNG